MTPEETESIRKEIDKQVATYLELLFLKGLLVKGEINFQNIIERAQKTVDILEKKEKIFQDQKQYENYKNDLSKYGFTEDDISHEFFSQAVHSMLAHFEILKRFLREILNKQKLGIGAVDMFGEIIDKMGTGFGFNKAEKESFKALFNVEMRNVIGHDSWYYKDRKFAYKKPSGTEVVLDFGDVYADILFLNHLMTSLSLQYISNYYPKLS